MSFKQQWNYATKLISSPVRKVRLPVQKKYPVLVQHLLTSQHFYYPWSQQGTAEKKKKKKRQTSAKRHDDILTPQLLRCNKIDSSWSENTSEEIRPISPCTYACSGYLWMKQMTLLQGLSSARSKTVLQDWHSPTRSAIKI